MDLDRFLFCYRTKSYEIFCASVQSMCIEQEKEKLSVKENSSFLRNPSATSNSLFNKYICSIPESFTLQAGW